MAISQLMFKQTRATRSTYTFPFHDYTFNMFMSLSHYLVSHPITDGSGFWYGVQGSSEIKVVLIVEQPCLLLFTKFSYLFNVSSLTFCFLYELEEIKVTAFIAQPHLIARESHYTHSYSGVEIFTLAEMHNHVYLTI